MATEAILNKIKRSFTITRESATFLSEARAERNARSDSETLDLLLKELMVQRKLAELDAAYKDYYDTISDEQLAEETEWAKNVGPNVFAGIEP
jgi:hypothetical protein